MHRAQTSGLQRLAAAAAQRATCFHTSGFCSALPQLPHRVTCASALARRVLHLVPPPGAGLSHSVQVQLQQVMSVSSLCRNRGGKRERALELERSSEREMALEAAGRQADVSAALERGMAYSFVVCSPPVFPCCLLSGRVQHASIATRVQRRLPGPLSLAASDRATTQT